MTMTMLSLHNITAAMGPETTGAPHPQTILDYLESNKGPGADIVRGLVHSLALCEIRQKFYEDVVIFRTLIRIKSITPENVFIIIPDWDSQQEIQLPLCSLPLNIVLAINEGQKRLHVKVNLGAETVEDLGFQDWEPA